MNRRDVAVYGLKLAFNAFLLGGCAYLVFWHGRSPWWFLLAVLLMASCSTKDDEA